MTEAEKAKACAKTAKQKREEHLNCKEKRQTWQSRPNRRKQKAVW